jgi:diguanylate cyclase (GGDEF)-like protein
LNLPVPSNVDADPRIAHDLLLALLEKSFDGVAVATPDPWRLIFVNSTLASWMHTPVGNLPGMPLEVAFGVAWRNNSMQEKIDGAWKNEAACVEAIVRLHFAENTGPGRMRIFRLEAGDSPLLVLVIQPAHIESKAEGRNVVRRDPLTNLPDRAFLLSRMETLMRGDRAADRAFAVLFIDLDNFKRINDQYGHLLGDRVLCEVAGRLLQCVRQGDHVTRYGGDEFVVLLEQVSGLGEIEPVIARIYAALAEPIVLREGRFVLSLSVGVAQATLNHHSPEDVLSEADRDMYAAKRGT